MRLRIILTLLWLPLTTAVMPARGESQPRMWDLVRSLEWDSTVRSVERRIAPLPAQDAAQPVRPNGHWALLVVDLTNRTSRSLAPEAGAFVLESAAGSRSLNLAASEHGRAYATILGLTPFGNALPPGATVATLVLFDIAADAGRLTLHFLPANQPIRIDECKCDLPSPMRDVVRS